MLGPARWRLLISAVPLLGPLSALAGGFAVGPVALGVLVEQGVALPEALRLTADGLRDHNVARVSRSLAEDVSAGRPRWRTRCPQRRRCRRSWSLWSAQETDALPEALVLALRRPISFHCASCRCWRRWSSRSCRSAVFLVVFVLVGIVVVASCSAVCGCEPFDGLEPFTIRRMSGM